MENKTYMGRFYEGEEAKTIIHEMQEKINVLESMTSEYKPQTINGFRSFLSLWQNVNDQLPENGMFVDIWIENKKTGQKLRKPFVKYDHNCFCVNLAEGFKVIAWIYINDYPF